MGNVADTAVQLRPLGIGVQQLRFFVEAATNTRAIHERTGSLLLQ